MNGRDPSPVTNTDSPESSVLIPTGIVRFDMNRRQPPETPIPPLLHVSEKGKILWGSSPALRLLRTYWDWTKASAQLPTALRQMVSCRAHANGTSPPQLNKELLIGGKRGAILLVRLIEDNNRLLLLLDERPTSAAASAHGLTKRETEVFRWLAAGKSNKEIGTILAISPRTVEKHLERIFQYLGVETRTAAAAEFYRLTQVPSSLPQHME
jgi:DNA-binding CsgD family transcriptional regulator